MKGNQKIRVLLVSDSLCHSTGYYVVAKGLREAGIEVIMGGFQTPTQIVESAVQEDVDFIGYRIMDGAPDILVQRLMEILRQRNAHDIKVILGGIIPPPIMPELKALGIEGIFTPGTKISAIVEHINSNM
ncbi:MAG: cobalamin-dependent protein [Thermodesulfobacteriota bacterium]|nr:cobalamin-dependent protein [Thermodesulfobacteriota bacterium]